MKLLNRIHSDDTRPWYAPYVPPGMKLEGELIFLLIALLAALTYATGFLARLFGQIDLLYMRVDDTRELIPGAVIAPFYEVFDGAWTGYWIVLLCALGYGIYHSLYYRQESMSIYTMRRLPDHSSFFRYTWTLTVCEILVCFLAAFFCVLLSYGFYHWLTPEECIPDGQWTLFWENLFTDIETKGNLYAETRSYQ